MPATPRAELSGDSYERIVQAATLLFAAHGFHGASTREIAAAAGLNIATVSYHAGSKADLYRAVFRRLALREQELVAAFAGRADTTLVANATALRDLLAELIDALLAMTMQYPETPLLWVRRWLERPDPAADAAIDAEDSLPAFQPVRDLIIRAQAAGSVRSAGLDLGLFLQSFSWMLYGYFLGGPLDWQTARDNPYDPARLAAFKAFLHDYMCRMLGLNAESG